jgi:hypothetical protein
MTTTMHGTRQQQQRTSTSGEHAMSQNIVGCAFGASWI